MTCPPPARHRLAAAVATVLAVPFTAAVLAGTAHAADEAIADGQWRGNAGAALSASSGNTRSRSLLLNADLTRLTEGDKISLGGNIQYARSEVDGSRDTTANQIGAYGQYDHNLSPRLFAFGRLTLDRDRVVDLDLRTGANAGLGWKLIDRRDLRFAIFGGVGVAEERYRSAQTIDGDTDTRFRRTTLLLAEESEHTLSTTTSFKQRLELLPGIAGDKGNRARLRADLGVALNRTMSLNVGLISTRNSAPPDGQRKTDTSLFTGLNVRLGAV
jgi:putative salt-induced outer membrane protein